MNDRDRGRMHGLFAELKRRNVVRVGLAYLAVAWLVIQLVGEIGPILDAPDWFARLVLGLLAVGFVAAIILSWIFELTDRGLRTTAEIDRDATLQAVHGRALDFIIIGALLVALAYFVWESRFRPEPGATADVVSIAVLPFRDLSEAGDQAYLAEGFAEEILNELARIPGLKVAGRTSSFAFRDHTVSPAEIAGALNVGHLLEGSVRSSAGRLRVSAQLINAEDGFQLWSREFEGEAADVFSMQDQISSLVVEGLRLEFDSVPASGTADPGAYDDYLLGRYHLARRTTSGIRLAIEHFRAAIERDAAYSPAWSGLGTALAVSPWYGIVDDPGVVAEEARAAADRAIQLDPENSEGWALLGMVHTTFDRDWAAAGAMLRKAIELQPSSALNANMYGDLLYITGDYRNALVHEGRAAELEPLSPLHQHELALVYRMLGRLEDALRLEREAIALGPEFRNAWGSLAVMLWMDGRRAELRTLAKEHAEVLGPYNGLWIRAVTALWAGDEGDAQAAVAELAALADAGRTSLTHAAHLAALAGDDVMAADLVRRAVESGDPVLISPLYFFLPEDWPHLPALRQALRDSGLDHLFDLRRANIAADRGRVRYLPGP